MSHLPTELFLGIFIILIIALIASFWEISSLDKIIRKLEEEE